MLKPALFSDDSEPSLGLRFRDGGPHQCLSGRPAMGSIKLPNHNIRSANRFNLPVSVRGNASMN